jgi:hypothetical protein
MAAWIRHSSNSGALQRHGIGPVASRSLAPVARCGIAALLRDLIAIFEPRHQLYQEIRMNNR